MVYIKIKVAQRVMALLPPWPKVTSLSVCSKFPFPRARVIWYSVEALVLVQQDCCLPPNPLSMTLAYNSWYQVSHCLWSKVDVGNEPVIAYTNTEMAVIVPSILYYLRHFYRLLVLISFVLAEVADWICDFHGSCCTIPHFCVLS